jgi:hypothetical protein
MAPTGNAEVSWRTAIRLKYIGRNTCGFFRFLVMEGSFESSEEQPNQTLSVNIDSDSSKAAPEMAFVASQSDFTSLTFSIAEDDIELVDTSVKHSKISRSGSLSKIVDRSVSDNIPKNCITPEVLALIEKWESTMNETSHFHVMDGSRVEDPMPPPTRFYLTRWRSIGMQVLDSLDTGRWMSRAVID